MNLKKKVMLHLYLAWIPNFQRSTEEVILFLCNCFFYLKNEYGDIFITFKPEGGN